MRTDWFVIFVVSGVGTVLGGVLIDMVPAGRSRPRIISQAVGQPRTVSVTRGAEDQLRELREMQLARLRARPVAESSARPSTLTVAARPDSAAANPGHAGDETAKRRSDTLDVAVRQDLDDTRVGGQDRDAPSASTGITPWVTEPPSLAGSSRPPSRSNAESHHKRMMLAAAPAAAEALARELPATQAASTAPSAAETRAATDHQDLSAAEERGAEEDWLTRPRPEGVPPYRLLHRAREYRSKRVYAELLIPSLEPSMDHGDIKRIAKAIAKYEGIDSMTMYCTMAAREANYSMDFLDAHPGALAQGLLGRYERGWFKPYKPK